MGTQIGGHQKKRQIRVSPAQEIQAAVRHPVGGMVFFLINPGPCHPGIAFHSGVRHVAADPLFLLEPVKIIVRHLLVLMISDRGITIIVQVAIVQLHIVKTQIVSERVHVHFPHALGIISSLCKLSRQGMRIIPAHAVRIAHPFMGFLAHAGVQRRSGWNAGRTGGIGVFKPHSLRSQRVQIRSLHIRMPGAAHAVPPELIRH